MVAEGGRGKSVSQVERAAEGKAAESPCETGAREAPLHHWAERCQARGRDGDAKCHWVEKQIGGEKIYDFRVDV